MNARCAGKTVRSLENACHTWALRGVFTTRCYTNPRLPLPFYVYLSQLSLPPHTAYCYTNMAQEEGEGGESWFSCSSSVLRVCAVCVCWLPLTASRNICHHSCHSLPVRVTGTFTQLLLYTGVQIPTRRGLKKQSQLPHLVTDWWQPSIHTGVTLPAQWPTRTAWPSVLHNVAALIGITDCHQLLMTSRSSTTWLSNRGKP